MSKTSTFPALHALEPSAQDKEGVLLAEVEEVVGDLSVPGIENKEGRSGH